MTDDLDPEELMPVTLEVRRHTDNDGDVLTPGGVEAALLLGRHLVDVRFDLVVSSGAQRATQTAANVLAGGGLQPHRGVVVEPGLRSEVEDRWRAAYREAGSAHLDDLRRADPELVEADAEVLGAALRRLAALLDNGERALVIGHSPTNEAAVLGLTGTIIEPLGKGQGVVVTGSNETWEVTAASAVR